MRLFANRTDFLEAVGRSHRLGRLLGLDVGTKRVGLALTDLGRMIVSPQGMLDRRRFQTDATFAAELNKIVIANEVVGLVFGLPLMDGRETPFSRQVLYFIEALSAAALQRPQLSESSSSSLSYKLIPLATLPCTFEDESFSSSEARALSGLTSQRRGVLLKRKDSLAACLILQRFLEDGDDH